MELFFLSLFLLPLSIALTFCFLIYKNKDHATDLNLPPGSYGWPIIGETLDFLGSGQNGTPESFVQDRMNKYSDQIFKTALLLEPTAVFCGPNGHKFLFSNENKLVVSSWPGSVRNLLQSSIINKLGDEAKQTRKLLMAFLKPEALQGYVRTMDAVTRRHMETEWESKREVTVFPLVKMYTFSLACCLFASIEDMDHISKLADLFNILLKGLVVLPLNFPGTTYYWANKAADAIRGELRAMVERRRTALGENTASPNQDLLSHLLVTADENGRFMPEKEVVDNILALFFGGHDTTNCAVAFLMKYLAEMPNIYYGILREQREIAASKGPKDHLDWEGIQKMKYSWNVANEVMRLAPPVQGNFRKSISDFTYAGSRVPKGWKFYWSVNSTHKNPNYFPDPEKFDPSRFEGDGPTPYTFVPFGGGPRMCPGKEYARLEILVFLHNVVKRFKWEAVFPDEKITVDPLPAPVKGLPVRLQPHLS
ncbi:beta-amyrin 28-monooxygenase-like [Magnolia sinica]|uniref:beta-amyrin 28-monooxygenase-like n=1 Tax=Magnolia sinica TaxID=86752 RepID=UPI00265B6832|nr:beta-amyrin 28-monooxygenase-like [Magnolia sinica]